MLTWPYPLQGGCLNILRHNRVYQKKLDLLLRGRIGRNSRADGDWTPKLERKKAMIDRLAFSTTANDMFGGGPFFYFCARS